MKLGVLFSGGKDSALALSRAMQHEEVACLITVMSKNTASYMFHTPNIGLTKLQAEAIGLPLIKQVTEGQKEEELRDLKTAVAEAKSKFSIEGMVTGAVESVYQAERVQRICSELDLWCLNPLWKMNQRELLSELVSRGFKAIISGVFAYPLDRSWLGRKIDEKAVSKLVKLEEDYGISPSGEGGEIETTVLDAPFFKSRIRVVDSEVDYKDNSGVFVIKKAELESK